MSSTTLNKTPLHDWHLQSGAFMTDFGGWHLPVRYQSDKIEHQAVREAVGLFDVSHMGELLVEGTRAVDLLQYTTCNDISKIPIGAARYNALTTPEGGAWDDLLVYRLAEERYLLVVNAANQDRDFNWLQEQNSRFGASLHNVGSNYALLALQGPLAADVLESISDLSVRDLRYYRFLEGELLGCPVLLSRTGYTASDGFELYLSPQHAETIWTKLLEAGVSFGIKPCGLSARDSLRLEGGLHLYGHELDQDISLYEAGLDWIIKPEKGDFIGKEALLRSRENPQRRLVGFQMQEFGIPRHGFPILNQEEQTVGSVTSGLLSPTFNTPIGMAYVPTELSKIGSTFLVQVRKRRLAASVVALPFYHISRST